MHDRFFVLTVLRNHICCFLGVFATFEQQLIVSEENKVDTLEEHNGKNSFYNNLLSCNSNQFNTFL